MHWAIQAKVVNFLGAFVFSILNVLVIHKGERAGDHTGRWIALFGGEATSFAGLLSSHNFLSSSKV